VKSTEGNIRQAVHERYITEITDIYYPESGSWRSFFITRDFPE